MRRTMAAVATVGLAATFALAGCGSDSSSSNSSSSSSSSSGQAKGACSLDNPPQSGAKEPPKTDLGQASGKVGAILPDTTSSTRYTLYDQPLLKKNLSAAGLTPN